MLLSDACIARRFSSRESSCLVSFSISFLSASVVVFSSGSANPWPLWWWWGWCDEDRNGYGDDILPLNVVLWLLFDEVYALQHVCDVINPSLLHAKLFSSLVQVQYAIVCHLLHHVLWAVYITCYVVSCVCVYSVVTTMSQERANHSIHYRVSLLMVWWFVFPLLHWNDATIRTTPQGWRDSKRRRWIVTWQCVVVPLSRK